VQCWEDLVAHLYRVIPYQESVSLLEMEIDNGYTSVTGLKQLEFSKSESRLSLPEARGEGLERILRKAECLPKGTVSCICVTLL